jgi:hypothetical protein
MAASAWTKAAAAGKTEAIILKYGRDNADSN